MPIVICRSCGQANLARMMVGGRCPECREASAELVPISIAAAMLSVSIATVRRLVTSGRLPASRMATGKGWRRFRIADLEDFLEDCRSDSP